eukprot:evm.model.scf_2273.2 EVM.evm.TU.scf_2273.2   scf_2273:5411-5836(+)
MGGDWGQELLLSWARENEELRLRWHDWFVVAMAVRAAAQGRAVLVLRAWRASPALRLQVWTHDKAITQFWVSGFTARVETFVNVDQAPPWRVRDDDGRRGDLKGNAGEGRGIYIIGAADGVMGVRRGGFSGGVGPGEADCN